MSDAGVMTAGNGGAAAAGSTAQSGLLLRQLGDEKLIASGKAGKSIDMPAGRGMSQPTGTGLTEIGAAAETELTATGVTPKTGMTGLIEIGAAGKASVTGMAQAGIGTHPGAGSTGIRLTVTGMRAGTGALAGSRTETMPKRTALLMTKQKQCK